MLIYNNYVFVIFSLRHDPNEIFADFNGVLKEVAGVFDVEILESAMNAMDAFDSVTITKSGNIFQDSRHYSYLIHI